MNYHLAQVNVAIAKYACNDPRFAGFVDNLNRIYAMAETLPGFVWRHVTIDDDLQQKGPTEDAFTFGRFFEAPQTPESAVE